MSSKEKRNRTIKEDIVLELVSNKVKVHPRKQYILDVYGREPETLGELADCVIAVITEYKDSKQKVEAVGFSWDVTYREVMNTHSAPLCGIINWGRKEGPLSYPGWSGRVWIRYKGPCPSFGSDPFVNTLTYTGTGGLGSYKGPWESVATARWNRYGSSNKKDIFPEPEIYSWDYRFYSSDWPGLEDGIRQQMVYDKLAGTYTKMQHKFRWEDSETKIKDAEFLAYCAANPVK